MKQNDIEYTITPPKGLLRIDFAEIWRFRDLLRTFVWRDIKVRYKQTLIGIAWAVFQPLIAMLIFTFFFGKVLNVPSEGIPYPIFVYTGLLLWNYYSSALTSISNSMVDNSNIIKKVYFPRLILPASVAVTPVVDFGISFLVLMGLMAYYSYWPQVIGLLLVPALLLITSMGALGLGLLFTSINVKYRDVRYVLPFFIQLLFFLTPVIYPVSVIPEKFQWLLNLNPMSGVIDTARSALLGVSAIDWPVLGIALGISVLLLIAGIAYFRKTESSFADDL